VWKGNQTATVRRRVKRKKERKWAVSVPLEGMPLLRLAMLGQMARRRV